MMDRIIRLVESRRLAEEEQILLGLANFLF